MFNFDAYYDFLRDVVGASEEALDLAFGMNGCNENTAKDILWYYTAYSDFESYCEDNGLEF